MSSSSSIDLLVPPPKSTAKDKLKKWFPYIWKSLVVVILCSILALVLYDIHRRHIKERVETGIKCYECTFHYGMNITEPGLPFEKNCSTNPKNIRTCAPGEVCVYGMLERKTMKRFIRKCTHKQNPTAACTDAKKPLKQNLCYCNSDLCNNK